MKKIALILVAAVLLFLVGSFYSYRLVQDPPGLTIDEAAIGYNAVLIAKTGHDETGRFLPLFALTINGRDWKQPSSIYATAILFKFFGASVFNLRLISVLTALISFVLIVYLNYLLLGSRGAVVSGFLFLTVPTIMMHSHLGQENIMPVPFVCTWLIGILLFKKHGRWPYLLLAGLALGLSIYSYKGMRAIVPPLIGVTFLYLLSSWDWKGVLIFLIGLSPFVMIMPWVNSHYAGALFDNQGFHQVRYYDFLYPYLSSFDLSALFIKGDNTPWHSTGFHGMFLISTLPLYLLGLTFAFRRHKFGYYWLFLLAGFFMTPFLFSQAGPLGSVYRFSRLLVFVPYVVTFCTLGVLSLLKFRGGRWLVTVVAIMILFNFADFAKYYWFVYPVFRRGNFSQNVETSFKKLAVLSAEKSLTPYIFIDDYNAYSEDAHFFEAAYFNQKIHPWKPGEKLPAKALLMTKLVSQPGMTTLSLDGPFSYLIKK